MIMEYNTDTGALDQAKNDDFMSYSSNCTDYFLRSKNITNYRLQYYVGCISPPLLFFPLWKYSGAA